MPLILANNNLRYRTGNSNTPLTLRARAVNPSEAASLNGQPAKTPIIAGSVCGGVIFIAWCIGFAIYFRKRYQRKKRKRAAEAAGLPSPEVTTRPLDEKLIIPPDPAVLLGKRQPGYAFNEEKEGAKRGGNHSEGLERPSLAVTTDMPDVSNSPPIQKAGESSGT